MIVKYSKLFKFAKKLYLLQKECFCSSFNEKIYKKLRLAKIIL
jgi:hypothetical protein